MNKIFRKCRDFGLMVRLNGLKEENSLACVKSLKKGNLPLCIIDIKDNKNWKEILKEIAFKEDLFIAAENINNMEDIYTAASNGAQFYIIDNIDYTFMCELKNYGFFFIPKISTKDELLIVQKLNLEAVLTKDTSLLEGTDLVNILDNSTFNKPLLDNEIFNIVDLPNKEIDYESWANKLIKDFLGLNYVGVNLTDNSDSEKLQFSEIFASTNKCTIDYSDANRLILECNDFTRTVNYFKWKNIFIDPNEVKIIDNKIVEGILDTKMFDFTIVLKEKEQI